MTEEGDIEKLKRDMEADRKLIADAGEELAAMKAERAAAGVRSPTVDSNRPIPQAGPKPQPQKRSPQPVSLTSPRISPPASREKNQISPDAPVEKTPFDPETEVADFVKDFGLEANLPREFEVLNTNQRLLVIRGLKQRIIDIVKSEGKTQYSEAQKDKNRTWQERLKSSLVKESTTKNLEVQVLAKLKADPEGRQLVLENMSQISGMMRGRDVVIGEGNKPEIIYLNPDHAPLSSEKEARKRFNAAANAFREIPYEWGQGKGKNKKQYERVKKEYEDSLEKAAEELTKEGATPEQAIDFMAQKNNDVKMDQFLNTHPEVEAEFKRLADAAGVSETGKDAMGWLGKITGKGMSGVSLFAGGYLTRMFAATLSTGVALPVVTGVGTFLGGLRGYLRANETLEERKKAGRYGTKERGKRRVATIAFVDSTRLVQRFGRLPGEIRDLAEEINSLKGDVDGLDQKTRTELENKITNLEKHLQKKMALLSTSIEHTLGKIEKGQVNFGDIKSSLANQLRLKAALDEALINRQIYEEKIALGVRTEMNFLFSGIGKTVWKGTSKSQERFIRNKILVGIGIGATAAFTGFRFREWLEGRNAEELVEKMTEGARTAPPAMPRDTVIPRDTAVGPDSAQVATDTAKVTGAQDSTRVGVAPDSTKVVPDTTQATGVRPGSAAAPGAQRAAEGIPSASSPETISVNPEAIVGKGEGIEHALRGHIENDESVARALGYKGDMADKAALKSFSGVKAHEWAEKVGYVNEDSTKQIWIKNPGESAYQFKVENGEVKGIVELNAKDGKILETRGPGMELEGGEKDPLEGNEYRKNVEEARAKVMQAMEAQPTTPPVVPVEAVQVIPSEGVRIEDLIKNHEESSMSRNSAFETSEEAARQSAPHLAELEAARKAAEDAANANKISPEDILRPKPVETAGVVNEYNTPPPETIAWAEAQRQGAITQAYGGQPGFLGGELDPQMLEGKVSAVYENNLEYLYGDMLGETKDGYELLERSILKIPATELLADEAKYGEDKFHTPMVNYIQKIQEELDIKPRGKTLFRKPETVEEFIKRALRTAARMPGEKLSKLSYPGK